MELIYDGMDALLPFAWMEYTFMKNALLAILLMTPLFGLLSTMVVSSRMAFFSDSLGHGAFTGIAIGALVGLFSPLTSLLIFSVLFALLITWIKHRTAASADTVIGVFSSTAIAVGLMVMSHGGSFAKFSPLLIGDILSITPADLGGLLAVNAFVLIGWVFLFNRLLLLSVNASLARSRGISTIAVESVFAALLAIVVAVSIQWVGILIINALLVLPGAAARNIARSVKEYHVASVALALLSGLIGLFTAYYFGIAAGAAIVAAAAVFFFASLTVRTRFQR
ncbi:cation ABC superfamily ATP binding cassette transporter, membrane protein [Centipeda periodontii DSM 2778]|uniref:Cation ABC superfamily ATP binding cassette transporter, membrane protein n=1 Tax=Centipeda periodontii DSM 2778 TaxID=888060 RepID=F5RLF2_9FIRM|nr:metal ABC transporter permease [Centipeda periodontii]EGK60707.1 cation ABC superfamily ATP binding cassette transporter, membrane protein [Centipeda periodontii DSM 2778]